MNSVIFEPLEEYEKRLKELHLQNTAQMFEQLVRQSGVDAERNRETVRLYNEQKSTASKLKKKLNWRRFWRVLACISVVLIPLVIFKITPRIKALREELAHADAKAEELLGEAQRQMAPLNGSFTDRQALTLIESVMPLVSFAEQFSVEQEIDMKLNYDFCEYNESEQSTLDVLSGRYNDNPFLFENKLIHTMGTEVYHGYKTISWTETYRDSEGRTRTRFRSETLHATVTKPKPFYHTQVVLNYCAQGGPELSFTRDATHLEQKSEREIERIVRCGERKLQRKTEEALRENDDFTAMSNSDFEVLFDALDRTDEVEFRTLFTPLAQTNMVELLLSQTGYGDDFHFIKQRRTNRIVSNHSQGRALKLSAGAYASYAFDQIKENFINKNAEFFKAVYFDFAPLLSIPLYQERPVHSLKPIPAYEQTYSLKECEVLANAADRGYIVHPETKTLPIVKSTFVSTDNGTDEMRITAYSYDIAKRVDIVSVYGGDGRFHNVPVEWDEYLPLEATNHFYVFANSVASGKKTIAARNGLCMAENK